MPFELIRRSTLGGFAVMASDVPVGRAVVHALELVALPALAGDFVIGVLIGRPIDEKACAALVAHDVQLVDFPVAHRPGSLSAPLAWSQSQDMPPPTRYPPNLTQVTLRVSSRVISHCLKPLPR